jgi:hypothetical protein
MRYLWQEHRVLGAAFLFAFVVTSFFVIRSVIDMVYWADPKYQDRELELWMTPRYISMSYSLPREDILGALGVVEGELPRPMTLRRISDHTGVSIVQMKVSIEDTVAKYRAAHP